MRAIIVLMIVCCGVFFSCTKPAEIDLPVPDDKLVLDAKLYQGDSAEVWLTTSYPAFEEERRVGLDSTAKMRLFENGRFVEELQQSFTSSRVIIYKSFYSTKVNQVYTFEASYKSFNTARGSTLTSDRVAEIKSASLVTQGEVAELVFTLKDDGSAKDAYLVYVRVDSVALGSAIKLRLRTSNPILRSFFYSGIGNLDQEKKSWIEFYLDDAEFNGEEKEFRLTVDDNRWNQTVAREASLELIVVRIEPIWYEHQKSLFDQIQSFLGIFSEPARVVQNVEGGYGIVRSGKIKKYSLQ